MYDGPIPLKSTKGPIVRTYLGRVDGVKPPIYFHCVSHAKRGEGVQIACKIAYVLNGRPLNQT